MRNRIILKNGQIQIFVLTKEKYKTIIYQYTPVHQNWKCFECPSRKVAGVSFIASLDSDNVVTLDNNPHRVLKDAMCILPGILVNRGSVGVHLSAGRGFYCKNSPISLLPLSESFNESAFPGMCYRAKHSRTYC